MCAVQSVSFFLISCVIVHHLFIMFKKFLCSCISPLRVPGCFDTGLQMNALNCKCDLQIISVISKLYTQKGKYKFR